MTGGEVPCCQVRIDAVSWQSVDTKSDELNQVGYEWQMRTIFQVTYVQVSSERRTAVLVALSTGTEMKLCAMKSERPSQQSTSVGKTARRVKNVSGFCTRKEVVREQPRLGLQKTSASLWKLRGSSSSIGGKQRGGYGCTMWMAAAALGVVE